jgi:hypothetical protein
MVELILSEAQLACLKAAVTIVSEESAALGRGIGFGSKLFSPEPFAVKCERSRRDCLRWLSGSAPMSCPRFAPRSNRRSTRGR